MAEDWQLPEVVRILAQSQHRDAFEGKHDDLAAVLTRHPGKDAAQTAEAIAKRMDDKIVDGPAFFESWLANAGKVEPPEREFHCDACGTTWSNSDHCLSIEKGRDCPAAGRWSGVRHDRGPAT